MLAPDGLPDPICPICSAAIAETTGYYDKHPQRRCRVCGYEVKERNPVVTMIVAALGLLLLSVLAFYFGQAAATGPTTTYHIYSLFSPDTPPRFQR